MRTIRRKSMLYKTGVEYGDYTMNHVQGCSHGCTYPCYAYLMAKRFGRVKTYEEWCCPLLVENTLDLLECEIPRLRHKIKSVQLCFTTDPFMYGYDEVCRMSIEAIRMLNANEIPCTVLTKGLLPVRLTELSDKNSYGITLVSLDESYRRIAEPGAAPCAERLRSLEELHAAGCSTWVSMEPYPTPNVHEQRLSELLEAVAFVDRIVFGRANYNRVVSSYPDAKAWYNDRVFEVTKFCEEHGIGLHVKKGTWTEGVASVA